MLTQAEAPKAPNTKSVNCHTKGYNASAVEKAALYNMEFMQSHCHLIKACLRTYELENEHHVLGLSEEVELAEQN
jgi:hypothetical protein